MAPLFIKGFLPQQNGSAIMLPAEITTLSGSDFDVDKMYIMLPEFNIKKLYNIKGAWDDFYLNNPDIVDEIDRNLGEALTQFIKEQTEDWDEAADLDGCSGVQRFVSITVPLLKNTMVYVMLSVTINTLKLFTQVYMLTNGGPKNATTSVIYQLYKVGFMNNQQGFSSAIAVVFFVIVLGISLLQNYLMRDK